MIDLDRPETYAELDCSDMLSRLMEMDRQAEDAWRLAHAADLPDSYREARQIVILGMGGSAIGGDLVRALASRYGPVPIMVSREYDLPRWVGPGTLVIGSSYSGDTEETIGAVGQALAARAHLLAITTGGHLARLAAEEGFPAILFSYRAQPRAALGYSLFTLLGLLVKLGYLPPSAADLERAKQAIRDRAAACAPNRPTEHNRAKQLARSLQGHLAVIYGGGILAELARRWKGQFNENAKHWAFFEQFPELNHNAVIGYEHPRDLNPRILVLMLTSSLNHPRVRLREQVTAELLTRAGVAHETLEAEGDGELAHVCSLGVLADFVTYYLALLNGADPSAIDNIDYLKAQLARAEVP